MSSRSWIVAQSMLIVAVIMLAVLFAPWDRVFPVAVDVSPPKVETIQVQHPAIAFKRGPRKMPVYHVGPCDDCCESEECCFASSCLDLLVTFTDAGALDGQYLAEWDDGNNRWIFSIGECDWEVVATGGSGGFSFLRPIGHTCELTGPCVGSGDVSTVTITPDDDTCDFCGAGDLIGATITVQWSCCYPEYIEVVTSVGNGMSCDCSHIEGLEIPINCTSSSPISNLFYELDDPGCGPWIIASSTYGCASREFRVTVEGTTYLATNISVTDLNSGDLITLNSEGPPGNTCDFPASIQARGRNCGKWCED